MVKVEILSAPITLYKMVSLPGDERGIAKLIVPAGETAVTTNYVAQHRGQDPSAVKSPLLRVGGAIVVSIVPITRPSQVVMTGRSLKQPSFVYTTGKRVSVHKLNTTDGAGPGIHGFQDEQTARLWSALFGK